MLLFARRCGIQLAGEEEDRINSHIWVSLAVLGACNILSRTGASSWELSSERIDYPVLLILLDLVLSSSLSNKYIFENLDVVVACCHFIIVVSPKWQVMSELCSSGGRELSPLFPTFLSVQALVLNFAFKLVNTGKFKVVEEDNYVIKLIFYYTSIYILLPNKWIHQFSVPIFFNPHPFINKKEKERIF